MNTPLLERHLAVLQLKHYLILQQSAIAIDDQVEYRRTTDILDKLTTEYGVGTLREAKENCHESY